MELRSGVELMARAGLLGTIYSYTGSKHVNIFASGRNQEFSRQNNRIARGFAQKFLWSGKRYRPGQSLKRHGKCSNLHSKYFLVVGCGFLRVTSYVEDFQATLAHFTWPWAPNVRW